MNQELKAKWVAALRSGEYQQTIGTLRVSNGERFYYCCLGVLYQVATGDVPSRCTPRPTDLDAWNFCEGQRVKLECMNDGGKDDDGKEWKRHSFAEIADYIEASADL